MCEEGFRFREGMSGRCECTGNKWTCDEPLHCERESANSNVSFCLVNMTRGERRAISYERMKL